MNDDDMLLQSKFTDKQIGQFPNVRKAATGNLIPVLSGERRFAVDRVTITQLPPQGFDRQIEIGHLPGEEGVEMTMVFERHMLEALILVAQASTGGGVILPNLVIRIKTHHDGAKRYETVSLVSDAPQPWDTTKLTGPGV